jgi:AcrR family transcriptional regulator
MPKSTRTREGGRRDEIVAQAVALFNAKGYAGTSVNDIADALGLSKPALYHYIQGKEDVLYWIHEDFAQMLIAKLESRLAEPRQMRDQLRDIVRDILALMLTHRDYLRVFFEHFRELDGERAAEIADQRDHYRRLVQGVIERGSANGEFRALDPGITTNSIFGMCNWAYQWYDPAGPRSNVEVADTMFDLLLGGLEARA